MSLLSLVIWTVESQDTKPARNGMNHFACPLNESEESRGGYNIGYADEAGGVRASRNHSVHRGIVGNHLPEFLRDCFCLAVGG